MTTDTETKGKSPADLAREEIMDNLKRLGRIQTGDDQLVYSGTKFVLPENMIGNVPGAIQYLRDYVKQQETEFSFSRTFNYRPWDGANAFQNAMKLVFGTVGVGKATFTMFGSSPPQYRTVASSHNTTIQVPWGEVEFGPLDATFELSGARHQEYGLVFELSVTAPRKYRAHIDAFFQVLEEQLRTNSIYRGKAFTGGMEPQFLDTTEIDPAKVIYSEDVMVQLTTHMWSLLRHTKAMQAAGVDLKRSVLVEGPYGTGKTLAGQLTAMEAVNNGWTFLICRPGKDDLFEVLQTAQLYAPAVVWFEDIDVIAEGASNEQISKLLDALDSIMNKGVAVLAGFTTNHVDRIQKGVLRPGRVDAIIHIGALDDDALVRLVKSVLPEDMRGDIVWDAVAKAFHGFLPAFAKEGASGAVRYAISRSGGHRAPVNTEDLVNSANGLRRQLELMEAAQEGVKPNPLDEALMKLFRESVENTKLVDPYDSTIGVLQATNNHE